MTGDAGERGFAAFIGLLGGAFAGWTAHNASGSAGVAVAAGLAGAMALYLAMTHRSRRRARASRGPVPSWWHGALDDLMPYYRLLSSERQEAFRRRCRVFLSEQRITGIGCAPSDQDRLLIAATAMMMTEGFPGFHFAATRELLVYADAFDPDDFEVGEEGELVGQVLDAGPVIFSLPELQRGFTDEDWSNVVVHELAHVLDALWGSEAGGFATDEAAIVSRKLADKRLWKKVVRGQSPLDDYAFENEQEFFAVCSEVFFEDPLLLREYHPEIYAWLAGVYRQELAELFEAAE